MIARVVAGNMADSLAEVSSLACTCHHRLVSPGRVPSAACFGRQRLVLREQGGKDRLPFARGESHGVSGRRGQRTLFDHRGAGRQHVVHRRERPDRPYPHSGGRKTSEREAALRAPDRRHCVSVSQRVTEPLCPREFEQLTRSDKTQRQAIKGFSFDAQFQAR